MKKSHFFIFILLLTLLLEPSFAAKAKKSKKEKKNSKAKAKTENVKKTDSSDEVFYDDSLLDFDDTEIITREQIDSMFSLANQLNADISTALEAEDENEKAELSQIISEEKAQLDSLIPILKKSSEWTENDEERLKSVMADYKFLSKKYKIKK